MIIKRSLGFAIWYAYCVQTAKFAKMNMLYQYGLRQSLYLNIGRRTYAFGSTDLESDRQIWKGKSEPITRLPERALRLGLIVFDNRVEFDEQRQSCVVHLPYQGIELRQRLPALVRQADLITIKEVLKVQL